MENAKSEAWKEEVPKNPFNIISLLIIYAEVSDVYSNLDYSGIYSERVIEAALIAASWFFFWPFWFLTCCYQIDVIQ